MRAQSTVRVLVVFCGFNAVFSVFAAPLGPGFIYQGQLKEAGVPLDGTVDLQFTLWDATGSGNPPAGGTQVGEVQVVNAMPVTAGLFTATLNGRGEFGDSAFNGNARWLQIAVRNPAGGGAFTTLGPRQPLTAAPQALFAPNAANATNATLLDNLDSTAFLQSIPVPLTLNGTSAPHIIRAENTSTGLLPLAIYGRCTASTLGSTGVRGESASTTGRGVYGFASALTGDTFGVMGDVNSPTGYAGYFAGGRNYFEGNVGIGTTSPALKLHVEGGTDTAPGGGGYLVMGSTAGTNISIDDNEIMARNNGVVANLALNGLGGNVTLIQNGSGSVGIGTATPAAKLQIVGGTDAAPAGGGYLVTGTTAGLNISIDNNEIMARNNGQIATLTINASGGDVVVGGSLDINYTN